MADPNRKINLDLSSDEESDHSAELELDPTEISLVKEFEEEFSTRFTEDDKVFTDFCSEKAKPPPVVFPFDAFHHNNRGGGGGRFQHRQHFDNRNRNYDGNRDGNRDGNNRYNNQYRDNRDRSSNYNDRQQYKRPRYDPNQSGGQS